MSGDFRPLDAIRAIRSPSCDGLTPYETVVLLLLVSHADRNGRCYPSMDRLTLESRMGRSQVIRCVKRLRALGFVRLVGEGDRNPDIRSTRLNEYQLAIPAAVERPAILPVRHGVPQAPSRADHGVPQAPSHGVPQAPCMVSGSPTHGVPQAPDLPRELPSDRPTPEPRLQPAPVCVSGSESANTHTRASAGETKTQGTEDGPPDTIAVLQQIQRHHVFGAIINPIPTAERIADEASATGKRASWIITAIADCAVYAELGDDRTGRPLGPAALERKLVSFCKHQRAPKTEAGPGPAAARNRAVAGASGGRS